MLQDSRPPILEERESFPRFEKGKDNLAIRIDIVEGIHVRKRVFQTVSS